MFWPITLIFGLFLILIAGYALLARINLKSDTFLFSLGLGSLFVVFLVFILNQFFRIPVGAKLVWTYVLLAIVILILLNWKSFIRKVATINFKPKLKFKPSLFSILILIIFLFALYKALFFPIVTDDANSMYAFISKVTWNDGFPPPPTSAFMTVSYSWPNTSFALFLHNYFFGLNLGFEEAFMKILIPIFALLNLLALYKISMLLFKKKEIAQLSVILLLSSIVFSAFIVQTQTTMYELLFPLLAIYSFLLYQKERTYKLLILTGAFLGATLAIKYTLIPFVLFFLLSILIFKRKIKPVIKLSLIAFPISLIFYLRNLIFFKNPFYPYLFNGINFDEGLFKIQSAWAHTPHYSLNQFLVILIPISVFIFIFFLYFLVDYIKSKKKDETFNIFILTAILSVIFWFVTSAFITEAQGTRHITLGFALISIFVSAYLIKLMNKKIPLWVSLTPVVSTILIYIAYFGIVSDPFFEYSMNLLIILLIQSILVSGVLVLSRFKFNKRILLALLLMALITVPLTFNAFAKRTAPWEFPSRDEVIKRYYPDHFDAYLYIEENLPRDARILTFFNQRYYLNREVVPADSPDVAFIYKSSLEDALEGIKEERINYILISEVEKFVPFWELSPIHKAHGEGNLDLKILFKNDRVTLYFV